MIGCDKNVASEKTWEIQTISQLAKQGSMSQHAWYIHLFQVHPWVKGLYIGVNLYVQSENKTLNIIDNKDQQDSTYQISIHSSDL